MSFFTPRGVAAVVEEDVVYLATLPAGPIRVLTGSAAVIWQAALGQDLEGSVRRVAEVAGVASAAVRPDVEGFLAELVALGLLEAAPADVTG